jgi:DNA gyrase subunit A
MAVFDLSDLQAEHILQLRLRRLTKLSRLELEAERDSLAAEIASLEALLASPDALAALVSAELAEVAEAHGSPRRTVLLESAGSAALAAASAPLEVADAPCWALLSTTGLLARTSPEQAEETALAPPRRDGPRSAHDSLRSAVPATARGQIAAITSAGRALRLSVLELPALPATGAAPSLAGGAPVAELVPLEAGEEVVGLASLDPAAPPLSLGTAQGVVKRVAHDVPGREEWEVIALKPGDQVRGAAHAPDEALCVFITTDAQLLKFPAGSVRPQGRPAGGMAGIRLAPGQSVAFYGVAGAEPGIPASAEPGLEGTLFESLAPPESPDEPGRDVVATIAGSAASLPGTEAGHAKVTPLDRYPAKGRGTGGVRCHRFLRGQDRLLLAWAGPAPARASGGGGQPAPLPGPDPRRDGSGEPLDSPVAAIG